VSVGAMFVGEVGRTVKIPMERVVLIA
jgi:hypothetical protein